MSDLQTSISLAMKIIIKIKLLFSTSISGSGKNVVPLISI